MVRDIDCPLHMLVLLLLNCLEGVQTFAQHIFPDGVHAFLHSSICSEIVLTEKKKKLN